MFWFRYQRIFFGLQVSYSNIGQIDIDIWLGSDIRLSLLKWGQSNIRYKMFYSTYGSSDAWAHALFQILKSLNRYQTYVMSASPFRSDIKCSNVFSSIFFTTDIGESAHGLLLWSKYEYGKIVQMLKETVQRFFFT
jgi:hypothetical protein